MESNMISDGPHREVWQNELDLAGLVVDDVRAPHHGPADEGDDPGVLEVTVKLDLALRGDLVLGRVTRDSFDHVLRSRTSVLHQVNVAEPPV